MIYLRLFPRRTKFYLMICLQFCTKYRITLENNLVFLILITHFGWNFIIHFHCCLHCFQSFWITEFELTKTFEIRTNKILWLLKIIIMLQSNICRFSANSGGLKMEHWLIVGYSGCKNISSIFSGIFIF